MNIVTLLANLIISPKKEIPDKLKIVDSRERYWGHIKTLFADDNLTVKIILLM